MSLSHGLWNRRAPARLHTSPGLNPLHLPVHSQLCSTRAWNGFSWYNSSWATGCPSFAAASYRTFALPQHVAAVYKQGSQVLRFQLLPLAWVLELCNSPGCSDLLSELFWGFKLLGPLPPGSQWLTVQTQSIAVRWAKWSFAPSTQNSVSPGVCRPHQASTMTRCCQSYTRRLSSAEFRALCHCHWSRPKPRSLPSRL